MRLGAEHSTGESSGSVGELSLAKLLGKGGREVTCFLGSRTSMSQSRGGLHRFFGEFEVC